MRRTVTALLAVCTVLLLGISPAKATGDDSDNKVLVKRVSVLPVESEPPLQPRTMTKYDRPVFAETPQEIQQRSKISANTAHERSAGKAVGLSDCAADSQSGQPGGHTVDHLLYCEAARVSAEYQVYDPETEVYTTIGGYIFDLDTVGTPGSGRSVAFQTRLSNFVPYGENIAEMPLFLTIDCKPRFGETCTPSKPTQRTGTIASWIADGNASISFTSPVTGATTGDEKLSWYDFHTRVGLVGGYREADVVGEGFRCDSAAYLATPGCVFDSVTEVWSLTMDSSVQETSEHIFRAQTYPTLTLPLSDDGSAKSIPGSPASGRPLSRLKSTDPMYGRNRGAAQRACRRYWGGNYSAGNTYQCDEYPFASTYQGGSNGPNTFSVQVVKADDNTTAGNRLGTFYKEQRIIDSDPFYVQVVDASGNPITYAPDPPAPPQHPSLGGDMNGDGNSDLVAVDTAGLLWFYPGNGDGTLGSRVEIGTGGWKQAIVSHRGDWTGDGKEDLLAYFPSTQLAWVYPGDGTGRIGARIALNTDAATASWFRYAFLGIGDLTGDGYPDLLDNQYLNGNSILGLGRGDPSHAAHLVSPEVNLGSGWDLFTLAAPGNADDAGRVDLLARDVVSGVLYMYYGSTASKLTSRTVYGSGGWSLANRPLITSGNDADCDGIQDLWATDAAGKLLFYRGSQDSTGHPIDGPSTVVGNGGWGSMTDIN
ncbi:FG-GAP-like repeat-containing protein [Streptomyces sp. NPDC049040]|uniref:NucA/NucB deoxyribonuclease domain-containing protein n=1 Tax=Streptomyces sp. NPDC049040 TaxID=3365593 RepID=UPI00371B9F4A